MNNVLSYKEGAHFLFASDKSWEDKVTQGQGDSYGMEFFLQKNKGRLTGWVGYTLSWNNRQKYQMVLVYLQIGSMVQEMLLP